MDGPELVVTQVLGVLRTHLPGKLEDFRVRYSIVDGSLDDIRLFLAQEPMDIAVDKPPMIVVTEQESDTVAGPVRLSADGGGGATYRFRYMLLVTVWASGRTFASTATARQRYGLAVREVLLQHLGIGPDDPGTIVLDPTVIAETYSAVGQDAQTSEIIAATATLLAYETQEYLGPVVAPVVQTAPPATTVTPIP